MLIQKIMIVDDDPDLVDLLRERIESFGFECQAYSSVDVALMAIRHAKPDLIILTVEFAQTTGTVFLMHIRDYLGSDDVCPPVIVLNSENDHQFFHYAFDLGTAPAWTNSLSALSVRPTLTDYLSGEDEGLVF